MTNVLKRKNLAILSSLKRMDSAIRTMDYFAQLKERNLGQHIESLESKYGGLCKMARALKIDAAYLHRLKSGEKKNPSALILWRLGLKRKVVYVLR